MATISRTDSLHRIHCLDGIRALAAAMVMVFHFVGRHGEPARVVQAAVIGQTGVDLFFVLSGFLITRILLLSRESGSFFRTFYARRSLRVFPLYYAGLGLYLFAMPRLAGNPAPTWGEQWWWWVYLQNVPPTFPGLTANGPGHFWSLAVEEHFYLVWPLAVWALSRRGFLGVVVGTLLAAPLLRLLFVQAGWPVFYFTLTRMDALAWGALLALLLVRESAGPARYFRWLLGGLGALLLPAFLVLSGSQYGWLQAVKLSLLPAFYFALLGFCIADPLGAGLARAFSVGAPRSLGSVSYGLYVFHPACFAVVSTLLAPRGFWMDAALSAVLTLGVAYLSFHFFENPILRLKKYFHYHTSHAG